MTLYYWIIFKKDKIHKNLIGKRMTIYFSPTERNELNFPISYLSTTITNSITNIAKLEKTNPDIDNNLNKEDTEISEFYKKYIQKKKFLEKTKSQKKLNKVKVYFIVKSKKVKGKEVRYALPIRSFDDLGNSILEKSNSFIASLFYLKVDDPLHGFNKGNPGARPFYLDEVIDPEPPFYAEQEFSLESFLLPKKYMISGGKFKLAKESKGNNHDKMVVEESTDYLDEMSFYTPTEYEYNESMIDNTFLVNSSRYSNDIRQKNSFNGEKEDTGILSRLKDLKLREGRLELFNISNIFSLVFVNRNVSVDKNIIPVFSSLEDAQDFLITVLDEIHQPFQVRRKIENSNTTQYSKSLSYLDDSFSFQNNYFFPGPKSKLARAQDLLIKSSDLSESSEDKFYHENKYQTKGPFFLEDIDLDNDNYGSISQQVKSAPKSIWREVDYLSFIDKYFPGQPEAYSWWESRDITETDKGLIKKSQDIKIISMGLGDFLEFWNNPTTKNAEALFIPSSNHLNKKKVPLFPKKSRDKFYDYQQKFRESKKQDTENYIYEIKLSDE